MKPLYLLSIFGVLLISSIGFAQQEGVDYQWTEKKNKQSIKIYTSPVDNSAFKAVRSEMQVKASVASLVALVEDHAACPDWADLCKESRLEKRISANESIIYLYNDIPFPVTDRDVYAKVVWTKDTETGRVSMSSTADSEGFEKTKAVRINNAFSQWHFTPLGNGITKVENFAHIDPNGPTPAWVTNLLLVNSPFKTMVNMRKIVESGKYKNTKVDFLDQL